MPCIGISECLAKILMELCRVKIQAIIVTYYNVPNVEALKYHYENLPEKLKKEGVDPRVPWLYNFKLDFRFR